MADSKENNARILKGSKHTICVEESVDNVIVVRLDLRGTVYRGVLLNSTSENIPYGVNLSRICGEIGSKGEQNEKTSVENSSLVTRHTYVADTPGEVIKAAQPTPQILNKSWKDKTIRNIRLRPRQVLCSKCKASCNEGGEARKPNPPPPSEPPKQPKPPPPPLQPLPRVVLKKRRSEFVTIDDPEYAGSKKIKLSTTPIIKKTSPVIKISFANPQGKGTVVKIQPKVQTQCESDSDTDDYEYLRLMDGKGDGHDMGVYGHKKVTISLKKARENRTAQSPLYEPIPEVPEPSRRTKHNKHKGKHKHRHRHSSEKQGRHKSKETKVEKKLIPLIVPFAMPSPREGGNTPSSNSQCGYSGVPGLWPGQPMGMESPAATPISPMRQDRPLYSSMISEHQSDDSENTLVPTSTDGLVTILKPTYRGASMDSPVSRGTAENVLSSNNRVGNTDNSDSASNSDSSEYASQAPPNMDAVEQIRPLMMRIKTKYVKKVVLDDGRGIGVGDIVWGKIHGFPWWPGRVNTISFSQKDNGVIISQQAHVSWFGSSTMSNMLCSDLYPFLEEFKLRFKKKKRGPYKIAIKQATMAAQALLGEDHPVYDLEGLDNL